MTVPGTHIIRQGGPRTALDLETAGYEIRDCIHVVSVSGVELWWLARWTLEGNTGQNLMKYGVGALDIEHCRVGTTVETWPASRSYEPGHFQPGLHGNTVKTGEAPAGRWPPNLVFMHAEGCRKVGEHQAKRQLIDPTANSTSSGWGDNPGSWGHLQGSRSLGSVQETIVDYECVPDCPVAQLDKISGNRRSAGLYPSLALKAEDKLFPKFTQGILYEDSGGASRFFPCFETREELQAWFVRLLSVDPV